MKRTMTWPASIRDPVVERLLLLSGILFVSAFGVWFMRSREHERGANFGLTVPSQSLNFGVAYVQSGFGHTLSITNMSAANVRVAEFETSCGCTRVEPASIEFLPGETHEVKLTLDLTGAKTEPGSLADVPFEVMIVPRVAYGRQRMQGVGWQLVGRVQPLIAAIPQRMTFGGADAVVGSREQEMIAVLRTEESLGEIRIESHSSASFDAFIANSPEPGIHELRVRPVASLPIGKFEGRILLRPKFIDGRDAPAISYHIDGEKLSEIEVMPPLVNFGRRLVGERAVKHLVVRSRIGREILELEARPSNAEIVAMEKQPHGTGRVLALEQEFVSAGPLQLKVGLFVRMVSGEEARVEVPVVAYVAEKGTVDREAQ